MLLSTLVLVAAAGAATDPPPRSLSGHRFLVPARVVHPFVLSSVTFRQGGGVVAIPDAQTDLDGKPTDLRMVGAVERVNLNLPLGDKAGLRASASAQVTTGIDADSALYAGARAGMDWELEGVLVVHRTPDVLVSVNPGLFGSEGTQFEPASVVEASVAYAAAAQADGEDTKPPRGLTSGLLQPTHTVGGGVAGAVAWHMTPRVGTIASLRFRGGYAEAQGIGSLPLSYSLGTAFDWRIIEDRPLVGQLEYRFRNVHDAAVDSEAPLEDRLESRHFGGLGLFWRTPHEAELGLTGWSMLRFGRADERLMVIEGVVRVFL